ncbi:MAG: DAK2 domain-containing protein, partial [Clostridia bacterium]|nr:DAK2 domain-containing protein [Clostridia bacterium]
MTNDKNEFLLDGKLFEKLMIHGANNLKAHLKIVNELNVFPIPDGDTGENMFMTISGGVNGLKNAKSDSLKDKACGLSNGMLLSARGNSGVILSQFFYGIATGLMDFETADIFALANAFKNGVKQAYKSVACPVEGTMLTVAREAVEYACNNINKDNTIESFFGDYLKETKKSVERTPELLPVLKEAGVIDSGGAGLMYIAQGMVDALCGDEIAVTDLSFESKNTELDFSKFNENSQMEFGYCTELLLQLQNSKCNVESFSEQTIIDYLSTIGDSIVAFKTGTVIKLHVHTFTPYKVLEFCQKFGEYLTVKIENMTLQHNENKKEEDEVKLTFKAQKKRTDFALVTVATGEGLISTFKEMGADVVLDGGQGKNPSIEDFINAFDEVNADNIFVLPNNSNIIMAAKPASTLYQNSKVFLIESKNMGQAYSALSI